MEKTVENSIVGLSVEIVLSPAHQREFLQVVIKIVKEGREEEGNHSYNLQRNVEKDYHFELQSEWLYENSMEDHIRSQNFGALLGALNVLSTDYQVKIHNLSLLEGKELIRQIRNQR